MADACYRIPFLQASFKGFAFICIEADSEHGRRGAEGEFPFGEATAYADLGRKIRHYKLKGVFRENSHVADANRFIRVCESTGPGTLVHPTRGPVRAACKSLKVSDHLEAGFGETHVDLEFVEANEWINAGLSLLGSLTGLSLGGITGSVQALFNATFGALSVPFYDQANVSRVGISAVTSIRTAIDRSVGFTNDQTVINVMSDLSAISGLPEKAREPATLWLAIANGLAAVDRYGKSAEAKVDAFRGVTNWTPPGDPLSRVSASAKDAIQAAMRLMGAAHMARTMVSSSADNLQQALDQYDSIVKVLSEEAAFARAACDNETFLALRKFLGEAQAALLNRAYNLPPLISYEFPGGVSSLVASYEIYGDARRFAEIEKLNQRSMPFLVGPGVIARSAST